MVILEAIGITIGNKIGSIIWDTIVQAYGDWEQGRRSRFTMAIGADGGMNTLSEEEGVLWGTVYQEDRLAQPIILNGKFVADKSFIEYTDAILEHDEKVVLLFAIDEDNEEVFIAEFDFSGYEMAFWPGVYSMYAFIIDPVLDDNLAIGYPDWGDLQDPNPIKLEGSGNLNIDFIYLM